MDEGSESVARLSLTMALSHYDRHVPFFDGTVTAEGIDLTVLEVGEAVPLRHGGDRHGRMLQTGEFDVCEVSLSSYLMARSRGMPFTAIPVYPRRLFSQSQMWVNTEAGIRNPKDLVGRRVGLNSFQTTLSVLARGDLQKEYGVPWRDIHWVVAREETVAFSAGAGVKMDVIPGHKNISDMLHDGEIDALMMPHPPRHAHHGSPRIGRLFADAKGEEVSYFRRNGFYPIMHLMVFKDEVLRRNPWAARSLMDAFDKAKERCDRYYFDPNWSQLAWGRHLFEEERLLFGEDPWPFGIDPNRKNLEQFMNYSVEQGLLPRRMAVEELHHSPST